MGSGLPVISRAEASNSTIDSGQRGEDRRSRRRYLTHAGIVMLRRTVPHMPRRQKTMAGLVAVVIAMLWFLTSPVLAGLVTVGVVMGLAVWMVPAGGDPAVHGPGHQIDDDAGVGR
jgi:hypothetical protein